ncbi:hypothetical protein SAMN04489725_11848 [Alicyclobacillus hesperidum]|uniref:Uncharacterized protein n=1 Tax=Alicyclobacillus hesperidum TaxID=89784 RepID=A0A1H2X5H0_9BACL|nr:hypothetical protein SAMN04489725_11848 [Alicyclobacillus hesperidum]
MCGSGSGGGEKIDARPVLTNTQPRPCYHRLAKLLWAESCGSCETFLWISGTIIRGKVVFPYRISHQICYNQGWLILFYAPSKVSS